MTIRPKNIYMSSKKFGCNIINTKNFLSCLKRQKHAVL